MSPLLTIDVGHPPLFQDQVEEELSRASRQVRNSPELRILKVIHGYGSSGTAGMTREVVRNWAFRNRHRFHAVIEGEDYSLYNHTVQEIRKDVGDYTDPDLSAANPGITIIWIK